VLRAALLCWATPAGGRHTASRRRTAKLTELFNADLVVVPEPGQTPEFARQLKTRAEIAKTVDDGFAGARAAFEGTTDEHLMKPWKLKAGGHVVQEAARHVMMRDVPMHLAHPRGQLTTYIRVSGEKVPAIYGPSADNQSF
jgi:hypothetical protein